MNSNNDAEEKPEKRQKGEIANSFIISRNSIGSIF
jgi:hypothetical protein